MRKRKFLTSVVLILLACFAQGQMLPVDRHMQQAFKNKTRDQSGLIGKNYWQNRGNYVIDVHFDPSTRNVLGTVEIDYVNNSPDTLKSLVFKLYPNLYKASAMRNSSLATADLQQGMHLTQMSLDGKLIDSSKRIARGTNLIVKNLQVPPHQRSSIIIHYNYTLNKGSFNRTGQIDEGTFFLAYFFPRLTVYDDVDGWNEYAYLGKEEFYNDYGDFKVAITVPGEFCVWATGELKNKDEIFEPIFSSRIDQAEQKDELIDIITPHDLEKGHITKSGNSHTWKFEANNVTDFAFALSRNYIWSSSSIMVDSVSRRRTRVDAVYHPDHASYTPVLGYIRKTVDIISNSFPALPFPYSHQTIVDGLDAMEYPMMVNNLPFENPQDIVAFTAHEVFHSIFPFYVGTNETKYSFMDEGWATMTEFMFHPKIAPNIPLNYDLGPVNDYAGLAEDVPIITPTAQLYGNARFADKDQKPALALWYIRDLLGDKKFAEATRYYILAWAGKHPSPYDFFNCLNKGSGIDLNWYWKKWYFEKAVPDLSINDFALKNGKYHIIITNKGGAPVPIHLKIQFADGSSELLSRSILVWKSTDKIDLPFQSKKKIVKVILGDAYDADIAPKNNIWVMH